MNETEYEGHWRFLDRPDEETSWGRATFSPRHGWVLSVADDVDPGTAERELQALRIGEIQDLYNSAKENLPERARALLQPLEDLPSRVVYSRKDLKRFLRQWENLRQTIQELRLRETEAARRVLD